MACDFVGDEDISVGLSGNVSDVRFQVELSDLMVDVDWSDIEISSVSLGPSSRETVSPYVSSRELLEALRNGVLVWYNNSGTISCLDAFYQEKKPEDEVQALLRNGARGGATRLMQNIAMLRKPDSVAVNEHDNVCTGTLPDGAAASWTFIVCNEGLNLVNTLGQGLGNDMFWYGSFPILNGVMSIVRCFRYILTLSFPSPILTRCVL